MTLNSDEMSDTDGQEDIKSVSLDGCTDRSSLKTTKRCSSPDCSNAGQELSLSNFYKKGDRWDSVCKDCKKKKKKSNYKDKKSESFCSDLLIKIANIIYPAELKRLKGYNKQLMELLEKCQKKERR